MTLAKRRSSAGRVKRFILPLFALLVFIYGIISVVRSQPRHEATTPPAAPPVSSYAQTVAAVGLVETSTENIAVGTQHFESARRTAISGNAYAVFGQVDAHYGVPTLGKLRC